MTKSIQSPPTDQPQELIPSSHIQKKNFFGRIYAAMDHVLSRLDVLFDMLPGVSIITNIFNITIKLLMETHTIAPKGWYLRRIEAKPIEACLLRMIPLLGIPFSLFNDRHGKTLCEAENLELRGNKKEAISLYIEILKKETERYKERFNFFFSYAKSEKFFSKHDKFSDSTILQELYCEFCGKTKFIDPATEDEKFIYNGLQKAEIWRETLAITPLDEMSPLSSAHEVKEKKQKSDTETALLALNDEKNRDNNVETFLNDYHEKIQLYKVIEKKCRQTPYYKNIYRARLQIKGLNKYSF